MLSTIEKVLLLQGADILLETETESLAQIAAIAQEVHFKEGTTIFREGEAPDALYIIAQGKISQSKSGKETGIMSDKETFGMWSVLDESPRLVTAVALSNTCVLKIEREELYDLLADHFDIVRGIFKSLVHRFRQHLGH